MKFFVIGYRDRIPSTALARTCYLKSDDWNDYSFRTLYELYYINENKESKLIGSIKIMEQGQTEQIRVQLPDSPFEKLDSRYCSLGQGQNYYEEMMSLPEDERKKILESLRDCVHKPSVYEKFKDEPAMKSSLLRTISVTQVKNSFRSILSGNAIPTDYHFQFRLQADEECRIDVQVTPDSSPPTNVHVIIGRNGVGKTRILSGIADELTKNSGQNPISLPGEIVFINEDNGQFANLVTIVFSAFDFFTPIKSQYVKGDIRYQYVGLKHFLGKDEKKEVLRFKTLSDLRKDFEASLVICLTTQRRSRWLHAIKILSSDPIFSEYQLDVLAESDLVRDIVKIFEKLSSGHKITLLSITKLVELVEERTLVLIDEPETHLHPPLLSSFTRALSDLIVKRNGVALIATHSPVVLQEVPRSCVTVVDRVLSKFRLGSPEIETFGENVGILTREIFRLEVTDSGYHKIISDHMRNSDYKSLMAEFNDQIGSEGRAIARSIAITEGDQDV